MRLKMMLLVLAVLSVATSAWAVPAQLAHQGRLLDVEGVPLEGHHTLTFALYDALTGGAVVWTESIDINMVGGFYSVVLGADEANNPLDDLVLGNPPLWLELTVDDGEPLAPRHQLLSVPYAVLAGTSENLEGGYVDASDISINGDLVIDDQGNWVGATPAVDWADLSGVPTSLSDDVDNDVLGGLSCADGARPWWDASAGLWACGAVSWAELVGVPAELLDGDQDALGALTCADDGRPSFDASSGTWLCGVDAVLSTADVLAILAGNAAALSPGTTLDGEALATLTDLEWSLLSGVPAGFADGEDADTLAVLGPTCVDGDRAAWDAAAQEWACVPEQVGLERIDSTAAAAGQVLTFDGTSLGWSEPSAAVEPCLLAASDPANGVAAFNCGASSVSVRTFLRSTSVSAGQWHACSVSEEGLAACWGVDTDGRATPPAGAFTSVSAGYGHTCGVRESGAIDCWGSDTWGESSPPAGLFTSVAAGRDWSCALNAAGVPTCWGQDSNNQRTLPTGTWTKLAAGDNHGCGIHSDGTLACWGSDSAGKASPPGGSFIDVTVGQGHSCGLSSSGTVECWGENQYGQASPPAGQFVAIDAGWIHTCGVHVDGSVECWGEGGSGQASPPSGDFATLSSGGWFTCGLLNSTASLVCWGRDDDGESTPP